MSAVWMLHFSKDWWKFIQILPNYTMVLKGLSGVGSKKVKEQNIGNRIKLFNFCWHEIWHVPSLSSKYSMNGYLCGHCTIIVFHLKYDRKEQIRHWLYDSVAGVMVWLVKTHKSLITFMTAKGKCLICGDLYHRRYVCVCFQCMNHWPIECL